jgi:hypothetical protein
LGSRAKVARLDTYFSCSVLVYEVVECFLLFSVLRWEELAEVSTVHTRSPSA